MHWHWNSAWQTREVSLFSKRQPQALSIRASNHLHPKELDSGSIKGAYLDLLYVPWWKPHYEALQTWQMVRSFHANRILCAANGARERTARHTIRNKPRRNNGNSSSSDCIDWLPETERG